MEGEDVQDQGGPVEHLHPEALLQVPELARRELVVEDHRVRAVGVDDSWICSTLPFPTNVAGSGALRAERPCPTSLGARRSGQRRQLVEVSTRPPPAPAPPGRPVPRRPVARSRRAGTRTPAGSSRTAPGPLRAGPRREDAPAIRDGCERSMPAERLRIRLMASSSRSSRHGERDPECSPRRSPRTPCPVPPPPRPRPAVRRRTRPRSGPRASGAHT